MTEIMMSIHPEWIERIFRREKEWEIRKSMPKNPEPYRVFIYETENGRGVVGEFTCDYVECIFHDDISKEWLKDSCVTLPEALNYSGGKPLYKWRIRSVIEYAVAKSLSQYGICTPPQSWCYVKRM